MTETIRGGHSTREWIDGKSYGTFICRKCGTKYYADMAPARCVNCGSFAAKATFYGDTIDNRCLPDYRSDEATYFVTWVFDEKGEECARMVSGPIGRGLDPKWRGKVKPVVIE
jgi:hypothetical protein